MFPLFAFVFWLYDFLRRRVERVALAILSAGPIPRHVAFIMDGNRRYARGKHMEVFRGHADGFQTLRQVRLHMQFSSGAAELRTIEVLASGSVSGSEHRMRFRVRVCY